MTLNFNIGISKISHVKTYTLYRISVIIRSLQIRTQRIFNNLIKQNQKVSSDSVLKKSTTVSSFQNPASKLQRPTSRNQHPESSVQHLRPESRNSGMPFSPRDNLLSDLSRHLNQMSFNCFFLIRLFFSERF